MVHTRENAHDPKTAQEVEVVVVSRKIGFGESEFFILEKMGFGESDLFILENMRLVAHEKQGSGSCFQ